MPLHRAVLRPRQVHYTGWLADFDDLDGKFDSSYDRKKPLSFAVGTGAVIKVRAGSLARSNDVITRRSTLVMVV
jgi:hypothetical protein